MGNCRDVRRALNRVDVAPKHGAENPCLICGELRVSPEAEQIDSHSMVTLQQDGWTSN